MIGYTGVKLLLAELSIAYIIIASSHNRRRPFQFLTNRRRNGRQNLILPKITFPLRFINHMLCKKTPLPHPTLFRSITYIRCYYKKKKKKKIPGLPALFRVRVKAIHP
jgi:hypothetical protein